MPTTVTRDGKSYTEYSPQEIDQMRLDREINRQCREGQTWRGSVFNHNHTRNPSGMKWGARFETQGRYT